MRPEDTVLESQLSENKLGSEPHQRKGIIILTGRIIVRSEISIFKSAWHRIVAQYIINLFRSLFQAFRIKPWYTHWSPPLGHMPPDTSFLEPL